MKEPKLERVDLELTNYCNLDCWMCPRKEMTRPVGFIDTALVEKLAPELGALGVKLMHLHLFGESILHPRLREILEQLRRHNPSAWLQFSTNATFLTIERLQKTVGLLDLLTISLDGVTPETYAQHRVGGDCVKTYQIVQEILEYRRNHHLPFPRFEISMIELGQSVEEKESFRRWLEGRLFPTDSILMKSAESFGGSVVQLNSLRMDVCPYLNTSVAIYWNGDVSTCCKDCHGRNIQGNVREKPLRDIFFSSTYQRLRDLYVQGELQKQHDLLCHSCLSETYAAANTDALVENVAIPDRAAISLEILDPCEKSIPTTPRTFRVRVTNGSNADLTSLPPRPVHLSYHWLDVASGDIIVQDGLRTRLLPKLSARTAEVYDMVVVPPARPGRYLLRTTLVQEDIAWFDAPPTHAYSDTLIEVHR
jgi:MoaA/NifB/PqqE/SkfB family radical SAM enzyme